MYVDPGPGVDTAHGPQPESTFWLLLAYGRTARLREMIDARSQLAVRLL